MPAETGGPHTEECLTVTGPAATRTVPHQPAVHNAANQTDDCAQRLAESGFPLSVYCLEKITKEALVIEVDFLLVALG